MQICYLDETGRYQFICYRLSSYPGCCGLVIVHGFDAFTMPKAQVNDSWISAKNEKHALSMIKSDVCDRVESVLLADGLQGRLISFFEKLTPGKWEQLWENDNRNSGNVIGLWVYTN